MNSGKYSILQKKQDKYSIARWAVCGRDNSSRNTTCYQILKKISHLQSLEKEVHPDKEYTNKLIDCWASDFRTHTTDTKNQEFSLLTNTLNSNLDEKLEVRINRNFQEISGDLIIFNPNNYDWINLPYQLKLFFKSGIIKNNFKIFSDNTEILSQLENKKFYKDGSMRSCDLIFEPIIERNSSISLNFVIQNESQKNNLNDCTHISTKNSELALLDSRGASISQLIFPTISDKPLLGFLEHGTFDDIHLSPDFFSGHTVSFDRNGNKITDLVKTKIFHEVNNDPIRKKLFTTMELPLGTLIKEFFIYENYPLVDLKYTFYFKDFRPASFRTAILTLNPNTFQNDELKYSLHNGGELESYNLSDQIITQDESTDPRFSNSGCHGSTNCFIDLGDEEKGITVFSDKSKWYSVPLINYQKLQNNYFARVSNSMMELDDTSMVWWKGRKQSEFRLLGRNNDLEMNVKKCSMMFSGLICKSNNDDISLIN